MSVNLETAEAYFVSIGQEIPTAALVTAKALIARVRELEGLSLVPGQTEPDLRDFEVAGAKLMGYISRQTPGGGWQIVSPEGAVCDDGEISNPTDTEWLAWRLYAPRYFPRKL